MTNDHSDSFQSKYEAGKEAFERGRYRLSVQYLEEASLLVTPFSRIGGDVQMWLVTAYQAADQVTEAIALCPQLTQHPHPIIRHKSKNLLYILEAPQLKRPEAWMTKIPDFSKMSDSEPQYRYARNSHQTRQKPEKEYVDLSQVDTQDNHFIWIALLVILLSLGGFIWFN